MLKLYSQSTSHRRGVVITGWHVLKGDKLKGARSHAISVSGTMTYANAILWRRRVADWDINDISPAG